MVLCRNTHNAPSTFASSRSTRAVLTPSTSLSKPTLTPLSSATLMSALKSLGRQEPP